MKFNKTLFISILLIIILLGLYQFIFKISETNLEQEYLKDDFIELDSIELNMEVYKENIEQDEYTQKFNKPILNYLTLDYLTHQINFSFNLFPIFFITDFKKGEITYLNLYTPENIKKIEENPILKQNPLSKNCAPHIGLTIKPEENFYVFPISSLGCNYFFYIDIKNKIAKIITPETLGLENKNQNSFFGSFSKKHDDPNTLYMVLRQKTDEGYKLSYYQSNLNLNNIKKIYETPSEKFIGDPHNLLYYKNKLLTTNFAQTKIKLTDQGLEFNSLEEYYNFIIKDTFERENPSVNEQDAETYSKQKYENMTFKDFKKFCLENNYKFEVLPGTIRVIDLLSKREEEYKMTLSNTGHFEVDDKGESVYLGCNSLDYFKNRVILWDIGCIDKFMLEDGKLIRMGTFTNPQGYRFITHRFFRYENKPYIITFGHPNRMFIIDGETMTLLFSQDIGDDFLSENDIDDILTPEMDKYRIPTMEVSDDGSTILFFLGDYIYLYDFPQRKVVKKIEFKKDITLTNGEKLKDFPIVKGHSNYLA